MAIVSIKAEVANGNVAFLGGAKAMNLLGSATAQSNVPKNWKSMLDTFIRTEDGGSFKLGGSKIVKNGLFVVAKGLEFNRENHPGPAYWEIADNVKQQNVAGLATLVRQVLAKPDHDCGDPWVATLIAAMFLSEVFRNPRSLCVNLMLLDLIESGTKYGRKADKEVNFAKLLVYGGGGTKVKTYAYGTVDGKTDTIKVGGKDGQAGTVRGGKLPMSHLDAMKQFQTTTATRYENKFDQGFGAVQKQATLNLIAPAQANTGYHFATPVLEKECTVALRWVLAYYAHHPFKAVGGYTSSLQQVQKAWAPKGTTETKKVSTPWEGDVVLTGLRDQLRDQAWLDCAASHATPSLPNTLVDKVSEAFKLRASSMDLLLV
jgi:hypothetical protein